MRQWGLLISSTILMIGPGGYDLEMYKRCVKETTDKFKSTSGQIIKIVEDIKGLEGQRATELAGLIQRVQDLESMKLRFTVDVQLAKQENQDDPTDQLMEKNLKGLQRKLLEITEEITETLEEIKYFQADLTDEEEEVNR